MTALLALLVVIAVLSGLAARLLVPGARCVPLGHTVLVGAAGTIAMGLLGWLVVTPLPAYLGAPAAVTATVTGGLAAVAAWRTGGRRGVRDVLGREHRRRSGGWTRQPRYP